MWINAMPALALTALVTIATPTALASTGEQFYSGAGVGSGQKVQLITADQRTWEQAWENRIGTVPPADLEGGLSGVLIVPARPAQYLVLSAEHDETGSVVVRCEHFSEPGDVGGWAAAVIQAAPSQIRLEGGCP